MRSRIAHVLAAALLTISASCRDMYSQALPAEAPHSVVVVELFTSEGCSSCPPADAVLQKIHLKQTPQRQLILGISEHVTYWDRLGWKDPYSQDAFTERQERYASRLTAGGPYTPQMVVDGRDQFVGSDVVALQRALLRDAQRPQTALRIVSSTRTSNGSNITFTLDPSSQPLDIFAVVTDDTDRSEVLRGENSGRSLVHVSVARSIMRVAEVPAGTHQARSITVLAPASIDGNKGHHLILFAQEEHQGGIVGADYAGF
jgi:hypothetical protein